DLTFAAMLTSSGCGNSSTVSAASAIFRLASERSSRRLDPGAQLGDRQLAGRGGARRDAESQRRAEREADDAAEHAMRAHRHGDERGLDLPRRLLRRAEERQDIARRLGHHGYLCPV